MKKLALFALAAVMVLTCASCGANYNFDLNEYITLPSYKGVEVSAAKLAENLQSAIDDLISSNTTDEQITDRAVADGDTVNIDYVGYLNGEIYSEGDESTMESDVNVVIGSNALDFEDTIIGHKGGDTYSTDVTFTDESIVSDSLKGKTLTFEVTVNYIKESTVPAYDDALITSATSYSNVAEYEAETMKILRNNLVWSTITDGTVVKQYPKKNVKEYYDKTVTSYKAYASQYGMSFDSFISSYMGYDSQTFLSSLAEYAKAQVKNEMIFNLIAKNEGITVTSDEYKARIDKYVSDYGAASQSELESSYGKDGIKSSMLYDMVLEYAVANAVDVD